jgi:hypothetical protein
MVSPKEDNDSMAKRATVIGGQYTIEPKKDKPKNVISTFNLNYQPSRQENKLNFKSSKVVSRLAKHKEHNPDLLAVYSNLQLEPRTGNNSPSPHNNTTRKLVSAMRPSMD